MTSLTTAGGVLGTADYMSPEQAEGRPVTARCDQYSLGGVMYALLAGRPPFQAKNLPQMLQLQRFANPEPVRRYAPDTPEQLERVIDQLLAKEPANRFPNTQVLARHLQAMVIALSRPAADDFALAGEHGADVRSDPALKPFEPIDATQVEGAPRSEASASLAARLASAHLATQDADTLAADDLIAGVGASGAAVTNKPATVIAVAGGAAARPARFTTVEEDEARTHIQPQRPWLMIGAQLLGLVAILGGMAAFLTYLSRPPSADELYTAVVSRDDGDGDAPLSTVEREIDTFLELYGDDPRAGELRRYKERIDLEKHERKLRRDARNSGSADPSLLPAEQLYVQAADLAENSPDEAIALFQSLIDLYGPTASAKKDDDVSAIVELAKQRLAALRAEVAKSHERQLAALMERLEVAAHLTNREPKQAAEMYRAIIDIYGDKEWAASAVTQAKKELQGLENK
jgi:serine/threonine-protein kinase